MKRAGIIGLGDMGSGLAKNLIKHKITTTGLDLSQKRMDAFISMGGHPASTPADVGASADAVFIMVMDGQQAKNIIFADNGLKHSMSSGSAIILTATITPSEAREIGQGLKDSGIHLIDCPVSGGFPGAQNGTLTLMVAAPDDVINEYQPMLSAISKTMHRVGDTPGMGQTVKACLQTLIGSVFSATFEAAALAAKAGVPGQTLHKVFTTSSAGCGAVDAALTNILERRFEGGGSHIATMYKDLTIALDMARNLDVPLFTASTAMQLFQSGKSKYPEGDNWVITRLMEEIVGAELHK